MDTIELHGLNFAVKRIADHDAGFPWHNNDLLGDVSHWERRKKAPGERVLNTCRHGQRRFYDFAGAVARARREGLPGPTAAEAAEREFAWLRDWCDDRWSYIGVEVVLLDAEGNETTFADALWGVEDNGDYADVVAHDLALQVGAMVNWDDFVEVPARTIVLRAPAVAA